MLLAYYKSDSNIYWTSLIDEGCEGVYMWCTGRQMLAPNIAWVPMMPNDRTGTSNCVYMEVFSRKYVKSGLNDAGCEHKVKLICEEVSVFENNIHGGFMYGGAVSWFKITQEKWVDKSGVSCLRFGNIKMY